MNNLHCGTVKIIYKDDNDALNYPSDIVLFKFKPSSYGHLINELIVYLDDHELSRAKRFHFDKDRHRFIVCRTLLKFVLAKLTTLDISEILLTTDENKKPYLPAKKRIHFNLSHTDDLAIIAIDDSEIGVDLEYLNKDFDFKDVMSHVYSKNEINTILASKNQRYMFYKYWTRKESVVKATGEGISDDLTDLPATDGSHTVDSKIIKGFKNLFVVSFDIDSTHVASISYSKKPSPINSLYIHNIPNSIDALKAFALS